MTGVQEMIILAMAIYCEAKPLIEKYRLKKDESYMPFTVFANEEKENGYDLKHYIEEFKKNKIAFDGKNIPEFIDTIEDVKARKQKEQKNVKLQVAN